MNPFYSIRSLFSHTFSVLLYMLHAPPVHILLYVRTPVVVGTTPQTTYVHVPHTSLDQVVHGGGYLEGKQEKVDVVEGGIEWL